MKTEKPIGFRIEIIVEPDEQSYHAYCPALKGLHTCGNTEKEALQNAKDAAAAYLRSLLIHGDPIPVGITISEETKTLVRSTKISVRHMEDLEVAYAI
jgi:predicted RNase H-like HicB family nuclease